MRPAGRAASRDLGSHGPHDALGPCFTDFLAESSSCLGTTTGDCNIGDLLNPLHDVRKEPEFVSGLLGCEMMLCCHGKAVSLSLRV